MTPRDVDALDYADFDALIAWAVKHPPPVLDT
jgi:hypothetical protein